MAITVTPEVAARLLRIPEAAAQLGISRAHLYRLITDRRNGIEVVHIGASARIPADSIEAYVERLRTGQGIA